jgi:hypothetical protein
VADLVLQQIAPRLEPRAPMDYAASPKVTLFQLALFGFLATECLSPMWPCKRQQSRIFSITQIGLD